MAKPRPVYGKTGTTNDFIDAWFIGFDENIALGVWVGRDDHTPIGNKETGARAALPIWIDFMKHMMSSHQ
jgi:penicillin-binding protein 1A